MRSQSSEKVVKIYHDLLARIVAGEWPVGSCLPTETALASEFGCGRHAISQAVTRLIHEGLVERRKRAGTRVLRNESSQKAPTVELDAFAFVYPSENHEGIRRTVRGFQDAAQEVGRHTLTLASGDNYKREAEFIGRLKEFDVKGAVVYSIIQTPEDQVYISQLLTRAAFPIVLACINLPGMNLPSAFFDDFHGGYTMTRYLLQKGLRRIGYYSNSRSPDGLQGYRWALREAGVPEVLDFISMEQSLHADFSDPLKEPTARAMEYLKRRPDLEGVVCGYDYLALGIIEAARRLGIRVPEDLKVTGVDDFQIAAQAPVPLTTYRVPYEEIGRASFKLLSDRLKMGSLNALEHRLTGEIVQRQSA